MPRSTYKTCKSCGGHTSEVGPLSWTRLCRACGEWRCEAMYDGLTTHSGPAFQHWRRRIAASVGGVLIDDVTASQ